MLSATPAGFHVAPLTRAPQEPQDPQVEPRRETFDGHAGKTRLPPGARERHACEWAARGGVGRVVGVVDVIGAQPQTFAAMHAQHVAGIQPMIVGRACAREPDARAVDAQRAVGADAPGERGRTRYGEVNRQRGQGDIVCGKVCTEIRAKSGNGAAHAGLL
ncbi:hypothetical protein PT2222_100069 [Paraburkholderia tropica]